jgi:copper(I)-binding protein
MRFLLASVLCLAALGAAQAQSNQAQSNSPIEVDAAWARATVAGAPNGVVYLTITNRGGGDDRLTGASTPVADKAEAHTSLNDNGIMKMRPLADVPVKAGGSVAFKPGGMHIMLMGLKHPLKPGESFPMLLTFDKAGTVKTVVKIETAGAMGPGGQPRAKM